MGFEHLSLRDKKVGKPKVKSAFGRTSAQTLANKNDPRGHGNRLKQDSDDLQAEWYELIKSRQQAGSPEVSNLSHIPIFLRLDPDSFDIDYIKSFGIEIVSEQDAGYIIGVSTDGFISLHDKIKKLINQQYGGAQVATLWEIESGLQWRVSEILAKSLQAKWEQINDKAIYRVNVSISCNLSPVKPPSQKDNESESIYDQRLQKWRIQRDDEYDDKIMYRQNDFQRFVEGLGGRIVDSFIDLNDSFGCKIEISGLGLKDLVLTYQYLFHVYEDPIVDIPESDHFELPSVQGLILNPPVSDAPKVCVIDSGIMEGHQLLVQAIDFDSSYCFIDDQETNVADEVNNGGHGTKVAGAILFPNEIPTSGNFQLSFWLQNAKILSSNKLLSDTMSPAGLMYKIVARYLPTRIYNLSVANSLPCGRTHMSEWAAALDKLSFDYDVLFVTAVGNIHGDSIKNHLLNTTLYPHYLLEDSNHISEPSQSSFSIAVGSVCLDTYEDEDETSFGQRDDPSSFTKSGPGMWGTIKPDVVEYGGDWARKKVFDNTLSVKASLCPPLVRSTLHGGSFTGRDDKGTSFAAPKATHILATLQQLYPEASSLLYRALLIQSARLPKGKFRHPTETDIRLYGYGIPSKERAIGNAKNRVTLVSTGDISGSKAHLYTVRIPDDLRRQSEVYEVIVEITLSYKAKPRQTRRKTSSYLSTWLTWDSSKLDETYSEFSERVTDYLEDETVKLTQKQSKRRPFPWCIRPNPLHGNVKNYKRQDSTLQKDWFTIESYNLPEEFSIAVIGHKGWDKDPEAEAPYAIVVSLEFVSADINVYEQIQLANQVEIQIQQQV